LVQNSVGDSGERPLGGEVVVSQRTVIAHPLLQHNPTEPRVSGPSGPQARGSHAQCPIPPSLQPCVGVAEIAETGRHDAKTTHPP
jgi:hypothetical protein